MSARIVADGAMKRRTEPPSGNVRGRLGARALMDGLLQRRRRSCSGRAPGQNTEGHAHEQIVADQIEEDHDWNHEHNPQRRSGSIRCRLRPSPKRS